MSSPSFIPTCVWVHSLAHSWLCVWRVVFTPKGDGAWRRASAERRRLLVFGFVFDGLTFHLPNQGAVPLHAADDNSLAPRPHPEWQSKKNALGCCFCLPFLRQKEKKELWNHHHCCLLGLRPFKKKQKNKKQKNKPKKNIFPPRVRHVAKHLPAEGVLGRDSELSSGGPSRRRPWPPDPSCSRIRNHKIIFSPASSGRLTGCSPLC